MLPALDRRAYFLRHQLPQRDVLALHYCEFTSEDLRVACSRAGVREEESLQVVVHGMPD
jgi:hypothetical protein